jgi:hypothetical protein
MASRPMLRPTTRLEPSIASIALAGTRRRRRERKPKRTASASGTSGVVPYIGHTTCPTGLPLTSATRKPIVRCRSERASALTRAPRYARCVKDLRRAGKDSVSGGHGAPRQAALRLAGVLDGTRSNPSVADEEERAGNRERDPACEDDRLGRARSPRRAGVRGCAGRRNVDRRPCSRDRPVVRRQARGLDRRGPRNGAIVRSEPRSLGRRRARHSPIVRCDAGGRCRDGCRPRHGSVVHAELRGRGRRRARNGAIVDTELRRRSGR